AVEGQHAVPVEDVVTVAVLAEVGVLDGGDAYPLGNLTALGLVEFRVLVTDQSEGALDAFFAEVHQLDGVATARFEGLAVAAHHGAVAEMFQATAGGGEARGCGDGEDLLEVQALARVDDVEDAAGAKFHAAVGDGSEVGGGVEVAAAGLLHDQRQYFTFAVAELLE